MVPSPSPETLLRVLHVLVWRRSRNSNGCWSDANGQRRSLELDIWLIGARFPSTSTTATSTRRRRDASRIFNGSRRHRQGWPRSQGLHRWGTSCTDRSWCWRTLDRAVGSAARPPTHPALDRTHSPVAVLPIRTGGLPRANPHLPAAPAWWRHLTPYRTGDQRCAATLAAGCLKRVAAPCATSRRVGSAMFRRPRGQRRNIPADSAPPNTRTFRRAPVPRRGERSGSEPVPSGRGITRDVRPLRQAHRPTIFWERPMTEQVEPPTTAAPTRST